MDSIFRTRGSGVSSDVETTIVPQLLSEIDGVETLENVVVIGASNREDMIDPAILRPGRLDVKIKIERPDAEAAKDIFGKYIRTDLPLHDDDLPSTAAAARPPSRDDPAHRRADLHRGGGEPLPRGDVRQRRQGGPVLQGLQLRRHDREHRGPRQEDGHQGLPRDEPEGAAAAAPDERVHRRVQGERGPPEHHEPRRLGPDLGKKGERIVYIRTLVTSTKGSETGRSIDTVSNTGSTCRRRVATGGARATAPCAPTLAA
jgi:proteasome-associated ATPase